MRAGPLQQDELSELRLACAELRQRLRDGEAVRVEEILERHPALAGDDESIVELVHVEVTTRRDLGQRLSLAEWQERFPRLLPRMEELIEAPDSFTTELPTLSDATPTGAGPGAAPSAFGPGEALPSRIGNYQILGEIGRGGMGVVYKARQTNLRRIVALKMILAGEHAGLRERARLRTEAEAAAQITHPNVVQVFEIGEHEGLPYLSMEYVDGGNLARMLRSTPQAFRWSARLIETLARAIHVAHTRGVVHRDLNPSNVLMAADGTPKISDFGLAKFLLDDAGVSLNGVLLGTPSYMAPEQVSGDGKRVGPRADVYALGALLYEALTGAAPFRGFTPMETLCQVLEAEVVPPSKLRHGVPEDLETICLKCLERDPARRYASAQELAEDLRRFQGSEPIRARRTTPLGRAFQWVHRQPLAAGLLGLCLVLFLALLAVVSGYNRFLAEKNRQLEAGAEKELQVRNDLLLKQSRARVEAIAARRREYGRQLAEVKHDIEAGQFELAQELFERLRKGLTPEDAPGFEWRYLDRLLKGSNALIPGHEDEVTAVAAGREGGVFASGDRAGHVLVWDLAAPPSPLRCEGGCAAAVLTLALDGGRGGRPRQVAGASDGGGGRLEVRLWDAATGRATARLSAEGKGLAVRDLLFSGDGDSLTLCCGAADGLDGRCWTWRRGPGGWGPEPEAALAGATRAASSPDGRLLAFGKVDGAVVLQGPPGRGPARLEDPTASVGSVLSLVFSDDGRALGAGRKDGSFTVWSLHDRRVLAHEVDPDGPVELLGFAAEGRAVVGCSRRRVLWTRALHGATGRDELAGAKGPFPAIALSPRGRYLAAGGPSQELAVWDLESREKERSYLGSNRYLRQVTFGPEGRALIMTFKDPWVRVWRFRDLPETGGVLRGGGAESWALAFSPADPRLLASGGDDHLVRLWDVQAERELLRLPGHDQAVSSLAFFTEGDRLVSVGLDGRVFLWTLAKGADGGGVSARPRLLQRLQDRLYSVAVSSDGKLMAAGGDHGAIYVWEAGGDTPRRVLDGHRARVMGLAFSPNPSVLASASLDATVRIWNPNTGSSYRSEPFVESMRCVAFSADGMAMAAGGDPRSLNLWSMDSWRMREEPPGRHPRALRSVAFSPDQRTIATGCDDGKVRLWDKETGQLYYALTGHGARVNAVAFSPDGAILASCDHRGAIHLWRAGAPATPPPEQAARAPVPDRGPGGAER